MRPIIVIGANYGDEGKGLMVDYLCRKHEATTVVRFNGGAQAGHTVELDNGTRHVFKHFGAGTFAGADTVLSEDFICNPHLFFQEMEAFEKIRPNSPPIILVHRGCLVTTPWDMLVNQAAENVRQQRHGSVGVGINETIERSTYSDYRLTINDVCLKDAHSELWPVYSRIVKDWLPRRLVELGVPAWSPHYKDCMFHATEPHLFDLFTDQLSSMLGWMAAPSPEVDLLSEERVIFEGAQGLGLDQNAEGFPHVTRSNTGIANAMKIIRENGLEKPDVIYVTRSYLTRHGAGPLPGELFDSPYAEDKTNVTHKFQGKFRIAPLDSEGMNKRIKKDLHPYNDQINSACIAMTHCDAIHQNGAERDTKIWGLRLPIKYLSYGPTAHTIEAL